MQQFVVGRAQQPPDGVPVGTGRLLIAKRRRPGAQERRLGDVLGGRFVQQRVLLRNQRAELAWWVARRVPGHNSPEQIGSLIADEYALLYETSRDTVERAALLRAEAAALRDAEAARPDWDAIGRLLRQSYRDLLTALSSANV